MITIKSGEEIDKMALAGKIVSGMHESLRSYIKSGLTTMEVNNHCEDYIISMGGKPAQIGYEGYPYATCISVNDEICHGFPSNRILKDGDILTVDTVVELNGYMADSAWSYTVGQISQEAKELFDITKESLYIGIEKAVIGNRLGDIGNAIQKFVEEKGYSVVRDFTGHGIGKEMHEDPLIPHYGIAGRGLRLMEGMVITIEPMINIGDWKCKIDSNGWTSRTKDGSLSCQFEHTLAITKDGPIILTKQNGE